MVNKEYAAHDKDVPQHCSRCKSLMDGRLCLECNFYIWVPPTDKKRVNPGRHRCMCSSCEGEFEKMPKWFLDRLEEFLKETAEDVDIYDHTYYLSIGDRLVVISAVGDNAYE